MKSLSMASHVKAREWSQVQRPLQCGVHDFSRVWSWSNLLTRSSRVGVAMSVRASTRPRYHARTWLSQAGDLESAPLGIVQVFFLPPTIHPTSNTVARESTLFLQAPNIDGVLQCGAQVSATMSIDKPRFFCKNIKRKVNSGPHKLQLDRSEP